MNGTEHPPVPRSADEPAEQALRRVLAAEAADVRVAPDGLDRIRERTAAPARSWQRAVVPALAVAAVTAVAVGAVVVADRPSRPPVAGSSPAATSPAPSPTPTPSTSSAPSATGVVPVYYVVEVDGLGPRLAREFRRVARVGDAVDDALAAMAADAGDPDHTTLWGSPQDPAWGSEEQATGDLVVTVVDPPADLSAEDLAAQQVVYTATAAYGRPVAVTLVDGRTGRTLVTGERAPELDVLAPVQLDDPADGAEVGREISVRGRAAAFEATVEWRLLRDGQVVDDGFTMTSEGQRFAPYALTVTAPHAGTYVIEVAESDASGGEGRPPFAETRTVRVR